MKFYGISVLTGIDFTMSLFVNFLSYNDTKNLLAPTNLSDYSKESIQFSHTLFNATSLKYLYVYVTTDEFQALTYRISIDQQAQFKKELLFDAKTALEKFVKETGEGAMALISYQASINEDLLEYITGDQAYLFVLGLKV